MDRSYWQRLTAALMLVAATCIGVIVAAPAAQGVSRCQNFSPGANLSRCNLSGANLSGKNLTGANLTRTILARANLAKAILTRTNMTRANLTRANLQGVSSGGITGTPYALPNHWELVKNGYLAGPRANLINASLAGAILGTADLAGANLSGADLQYASFSGLNTDLVGARFVKADLFNSEFDHANASGANFNGASFGQATLNGGTNFTNASFVGTYLTGEALGGSVFTGANFNKALLQGADLSSSDFSGGSFVGAFLMQANLFSASFSNTNFTSAFLYQADLTYANLIHANLSQADLTKVIWSGTTCPDGTDSDHDGGRCATAFGVVSSPGWSFNYRSIPSANPPVVDFGPPTLDGVRANTLCSFNRRQVDESGPGALEAAGVEIERFQMRLEVDMEPLTPDGTRIAHCDVHELRATLVVPMCLGI